MTPNQTEDDLRQILDAAQAMLDSHYPLARLRADDHVDAVGPLADFGTFMLALTEDQGGAGFTIFEEARLHAALGQHVVAPDAVAMAVAVRIARETGCHELALAIAGGETRVCAGASDGEETLFFDRKPAEYALIRSPAGISFVSLDYASIQPEIAMGHGRPIARLAGGALPANDLAAKATVQLMATLVSAHLLGAAQGACDLAVHYAKTREQFGQPIGAFQAIKHHCANMRIGVEMLSSQLDMAASALRDGQDDAAFQVAALARLAPVIALHNARLSIQVHGGIGFSAEADAHLFLKQSYTLRALLPAFDFMSLQAPLAPLGKAPQ